MATFSAIFVPGKTVKTAGVTGGASTAEIVLSKDARFVIIANTVPGQTATTPGIHVAFGTSGMSAADASAFYIPVDTFAALDLGNAYDRIRIFNQDSVTVDIYVTLLSN